ncbi:hypothetical protein PEX1_053480 [Penicillium expansum]|uniref:Uncharacterized protein n=1 Tax=Penicillium expansum TaxID=27334 RepID=A0A0A2KA15_PENEN|nr:hypothetical protein PEX2_045680 [Penicillium expansum]KGO39760.1 hypothetical protein PEXP_047180 [Penicillium expansum]KGO62542.1 hypothetical protein PEX2_045680 [Penicillium expansum]KGO64672.1 hypothetical protein PEX1_053480 [Penicillium expansum]
MVENIEWYKNATDAQNMEKSAQEQQSFIERHQDNKMKVTISFPSGMKRFPAPNLGPFTDKGEGHLEPYNRYWEVMKWLPQNELEDMAHAPSWMQVPTRKVVSGLSSVKKVFASDNLPPIEIRLKWIRGEEVSKDQETDLATKQAVKREAHLPPSKSRFTWDPRLFAKSEQFRDSIRRSLNFKELGLDLQAMLIGYHHEAQDQSINQSNFN